MTASAQAAVLETRNRPALDLDHDALFLDLDGTLAPIAPRPEDVRPDPEVNALVRRLAERMDGRLAVISGRTVADVDRLLEGAAACVAGVHGLERRDRLGRRVEVQPATGLSTALSQLRAFVTARPGLLVEDKRTAVTIHYRLAPEHGRAARDLAGALAQRCGLDLQLGDMIAELKTPGAHKGAALRAIMREAPFAGARPIFVGDDLTDEDGFEAANALGGFGVLVRSERPTVAAYRLPDVDSVHDWLRSALA
jgi:trehalose 6-phosphate phosphatase